MGEPQQHQRDRFIDELKICKPTHYRDDEETNTLLESFNNIKYTAFSSVVLPINIVIDAAIIFTTQFAGYLPGSEMKLGKTFYAHMPIMIYSSAPEAEDRSLIWANGMVSYTPGGHITLFVDNDLLEQIKVLNNNEI